MITLSEINNNNSIYILFEKYENDVLVSKYFLEPTSEVPNDILKDESLLKKYNSIFTKEVKENYKKYLVPLEFESTKNKLLCDIKNQRDTLIDEPINNIQVAKSTDRENIQGTLAYFDSLSQGKEFVSWTMIDNTTANLTKKDLQDTLDAYVIRKAKAFGEYQYKRELIEKCTTIKQLEELKL